MLEVRPKLRSGGAGSSSEGGDSNIPLFAGVGGAGERSDWCTMTLYSLVSIHFAAFGALRPSTGCGRLAFCSAFTSARLARFLAFFSLAARFRVDSDRVAEAWNDRETSSDDDWPTRQG